MNKYMYAELEAAALNPCATQAEINALGEWFQQYGEDFWNGQSWTVDEKKGIHIAPIYREIEEDDFEIVGYTFAQEGIFER